MSSEDIPAPPRSYFPDEIILYGVKLNSDTAGASIPFSEGKVLALEMREGATVLGSDQIDIAVVYGYGFEGHCYRLDSPKLMVFESSGVVPATGCGFDGTGYNMWRIDSKRRLMELGISVDQAQAVVLDSNMPANRAPNTYGNKMQLAHRGGRLSRNGGSG